VREIYKRSVPIASPSSTSRCCDHAWALASIGMPDVITTDRGTQFTSRDLELALSRHDVKLQFIAVESHHSLGAKGRAHAVLRRVVEVGFGSCRFLEMVCAEVPERA
jgi:transposase InsO family protein